MDSLLTGEKVDGAVATWNGTWGLIDFSDGRRAYVHSSACGGIPLHEGMAVLGCVVPDERNPGKWQAQSIERAPSFADDNSGRLQGTVTEWKSTYGFVQFSDGRRAYVHNSACLKGAQLGEGAQIVGSIAEDPQNPGKWQAHQVELLANVAPDDGSGRVQGQVTQWTGSYGFLSCADGRRAYVHSSQVAGGQPLHEGAAVLAEIADDPKNPGKWQAFNVELMHAPRQSAAASTAALLAKHFTSTVAQPPPAAVAPAAASGAAGGFKAWGFCAAVAGKSSPAQQLRPAAPAHGVVGGGGGGGAGAGGGGGGGAGRLSAEVQEWHTSYGFLGLEDGRRAYVHSSQCGGQTLTVGEYVLTYVVEDPRNPGKWQAIDARRSGGATSSAAAALPVVPPQAQSRVRLPAIDCVVTQWVDEKGYGFLESADGRRAYMHNSSCGGEALFAGEQVAASFVPDGHNPGKWQAVDVHRGAGGGGGGGKGGGKAGNGRAAGAFAAAGHGGFGGGCGGAAASASAGDPGVVAEWKEQGGYGFVNLDDGRRAYVHRSVLPGATGDLEVGRRLSVALKPDPRNPGKWCVEQIVDDASGAAPMLGAGALHGAAVGGGGGGVGPGLATGVVSDWNPRGFGFANFEDGRRAYLHTSQCGFEHLAVGEVVVAQVVPDERTPGKWQAKSIERTGAVMDPNTAASGALSDLVAPSAKRPRLV